MSRQGPREGKGARPEAGGNQLQGFRGAGARSDIPSAAEKTDCSSERERARPEQSRREGASRNWEKNLFLPERDLPFLVDRNQGRVALAVLAGQDLHG